MSFAFSLDKRTTKEKNNWKEKNKNHFQNRQETGNVEQSIGLGKNLRKHFFKNQREIKTKEKKWRENYAQKTENDEGEKLKLKNRKKRKRVKVELGKLTNDIRRGFTVSHGRWKQLRHK